MIGFCLDKRVQPVTAGLQAKDIYESFRIDPDADLPVDVIRIKIKKLVQTIDEKLG